MNVLVCTRVVYVVWQDRIRMLTYSHEEKREGVEKKTRQLECLFHSRIKRVR